VTRKTYKKGQFYLGHMVNSFARIEDSKVSNHLTGTLDWNSLAATSGTTKQASNASVSDQ
jgi:hypothetical protein